MIAFYFDTYLFVVITTRITFVSQSKLNKTTNPEIVTWTSKKANFHNIVNICSFLL